MSEDASIKIGKDMLRTAMKLGERFNMPQKQIVEQAIMELFERYKNADAIPVTSNVCREAAAHYHAPVAKSRKAS